MTGYSSDTLTSRITGMAGDPAEHAFRAYMASLNRFEGQHYIRTGYDRTDMDTGFLATLPPEERHRPDFIQIGGHWWEVQGYGADNHLKVKRDKLEVLWTHYANCGFGTRQVRFFIYSSATGRCLIMPIQTILWAVQQPEATYSETLLDGRKPGWTVPVDLFDKRLIVDATGYMKQLVKQAEKELAEQDEQAAADTRRAIRAAGHQLPVAASKAA